MKPIDLGHLSRPVHIEKDLSVAKIKIHHFNVNCPQGGENFVEQPTEFRRNGNRLAGGRIEDLSRSDQIDLGAAIRLGE